MRKINPNIEIIDTEYNGAHKKIKCQCTIDGHIWYPTWSNLQRKQGCPKCSDNAKLTIRDVKLRLQAISPSIQILDNQYINAHAKLKCKCLKDGYEWSATWNNLSKGKGCPKCANVLSLTLKKVKEEVARINPNIKIIDDKYVGVDYGIKCKCLIDDYEWTPTLSSIRGGHGCPECGQVARYDIHSAKEKLMSINPNIKILDNEYKGTHEKLKCQCLIDGYIWYTLWTNLQQGSGCPKCNESKGEKRITRYLNHQNIEYKREYKINKCKNKRPLPFDFAIFMNGDLKMLIEYDGEFHYRETGLGNDLKKQQRNDNIKNQYCKDNNIPLLRIPYWDFENIEQIISKNIAGLGVIY